MANNFEKKFIVKKYNINLKKAYYLELSLQKKVIPLSFIPIQTADKYRLKIAESAKINKQEITYIKADDTEYFNQILPERIFSDSYLMSECPTLNSKNNLMTTIAKMNYCITITYNYLDDKNTKIKSLFNAIIIAKAKADKSNLADYLNESQNFLFTTSKLINESNYLIEKISSMYNSYEEFVRQDFNIMFANIELFLKHYQIMIIDGNGVEKPPLYLNKDKISNNFIYINYDRGIFNPIISIQNYYGVEFCHFCKKKYYNLPKSSEKSISCSDCGVFLSKFSHICNGRVRLKHKNETKCDSCFPKYWAHEIKKMFQDRNY